MKLLVTGGLGFIGSNFVRESAGKYDEVVNVDNLSHGSNQSNLGDMAGSRGYRFVKGSTWNAALVRRLTKGADVVVNFAAETHVDRSISDPAPFVRSNVLGTFQMLEASRINDVGTFLQISTDEVYGDAEERRVKSFSEEHSTLPGNPYSATKAAAESLVLSYFKTYGLKAMVTRCTNNFGPYQSPEKLVPKTIIRALKGQRVPLYGGGMQRRSWIYVLDHVEALGVVIQKGRRGQVYNVSAWDELTNREIVARVLSRLGKPESLIESVEDRPGHDKRYSVDFSKLTKELGWSPRHGFDSAINETVDWYVKNRRWWSKMATPRVLHPTPWKLKWSK